MGPTIGLPGVTDVSPIGRNSMWATTTGVDPEADSGQGLYRVSEGAARLIVNLFKFEAIDAVFVTSLPRCKDQLTIGEGTRAWA